MARLAFMKKFKDGTPTKFREAVLNCVSDELEMILRGLPDSYIIPIVTQQPKKHTIRESGYMQKFIGKKVECFYWEGKPYRSKQKVWGTVTLNGFQSIRIENEFIEGEFPTPHQLITSIWVDGTALNAEQIKALLKNDGITLEQFCAHFGKQFVGFIYHFTQYRY